MRGFGRRHRGIGALLVLGAACLLPEMAAGTRPADSGSAATAGVTGAPAAFDPTLPFEVVDPGEFSAPHIDTTDGLPTDDPALLAAFAPPTEPGRGAAVRAADVVTWRDPANPNDPNDPDIAIIARTDVPDAVTEMIADVVREYRTIIDLDLAAPRFHYIRVSWATDLPIDVLGGTSTSWATVRQNGTSYRVPGFLLNTRGNPTTPDFPVMDLVLNANIAWDFSANPVDRVGADTFYLRTVLLHEFGHALGIASGVNSDATIDSAVLSSWGTSFHADQNPALPFATHRRALTKQQRMWAMNADGTWERIYDPSSWINGSSLGHLDENTYPRRAGQTATPGALMTPLIERGEATRLDGVILGLLSQIGHTSLVGPAPPTVLAHDAGDRVTVLVSPAVDNGLAPPADTWSISLATASGQVVASAEVSAAQRSISIGSGLAPGDYVVTVTAGLDRLSAAAVSAPVALTGAAPQSTIATASSIDEIVNAVDYVGSDADVMRLYIAFFRRSPDVAGAQYWLGAARAGVAYDDIAWSFANSTEFVTQYGSTDDRRFLEIVYGNVLGRAPDAAGFDYWLGQLRAGLPRPLVVRWIAAGGEFVAAHSFLPPD